MGMKKEWEGCSSFSLSVLFFCILPESKTRTNESRADEFEADWSRELDWVGTFTIRTRQVKSISKLFCIEDLI